MTITPPSNIGYGTVVGRFLIDMSDGVDVGGDPDFAAMNGTVMFTVNVPESRDATAAPDPVTIIRNTQVGILNSDGYLCKYDPENEGTPGTPGINLIADDDADLNPTGTQYTATFSLSGPDGARRTKAPITFQVLEGQTIDLTNVGDVPSAEPLGTAAAEAAAAAAAASLANLDPTTAALIEDDDSDLSGALSANYVGRGELVAQADATPAGTAAENTAAIVAALTSAPGVTVTLPRGDINVDPFTIPTGAALRGYATGVAAATTPGGNRGTRLLFAATTGPLISMADQLNWELSEIGIEYSSTSFSGNVIELTNTSTSGAAKNCGFGKIDRCYVGSTAPASNQSASSLIYAHGTHNVKISNSRFYGAQNLIRGIDHSGNIYAAFANAISFDNCFFNKYVGAAVVNPDKAWSFSGCSFEPNTAGVGRAVTCEAGHLASGVAFRDCWGGDNTAAGSWVEYRGSSLSVAGGSWALGTGVSLVKLLEACDGAAVVSVALRGTAGAVVDCNTFTGSKSVVILSTSPAASVQLFSGNAYPTHASIHQVGVNTYLTGKVRMIGPMGANGAAPPNKAANPGTATGTDASVINAVVTVLRDLGFLA